MHLKGMLEKLRHGVKTAVVGITIVQFSLGGPLAGSLEAHEKEHTKTPIKHVIVLIGENRTFDHLFATYVPKSRDSVSNLLSKHIIKADGSPGKNFARAAQFEAAKPYKTEYFVSLSADEKKPYDILPEPTLNFAPTATIFPPGTPVSFLATVEPA